MAKAAVEMAAWDLAARQEGVALAALLGGRGNGWRRASSLGIQESPAALARRAAAAVAEGYRRVKIKVAPGQDVAFAAAARDAVGGEFPLSLDANAAYTLDDLEVLRRLDAVHPAMLEQPLDPEDLTGHARLQAALATSICLDESITSAARAADAIEPGGGAHHQHQAGPSGRPHPGPGGARPGAAPGHPGVVRRHAGERDRAGRTTWPWRRCPGSPCPAT